MGAAGAEHGRAHRQLWGVGLLCVAGGLRRGAEKRRNVPGGGLDAVLARVLGLVGALAVHGHRQVAGPGDAQQVILDDGVELLEHEHVARVRKGLGGKVVGEGEGRGDVHHIDRIIASDLRV